MQAAQITTHSNFPAVQCRMSCKPCALQPGRVGFASNISKNSRRGLSKSTVPQASGKDFDAILLETANKFEAAENKPAIVGWTAAAFGTIVIAEWFIHLPLFDFLLGFPIQLLGLVTAGNLGMKYYIDKKGDPVSDLEELVNKVTKQLPGL